MITEREPESWQDLQEWTSQILNECGIEARTEVTLQTVRGRTEIDVLAIENVQGREHKILIECKNWKARVPQAVIHGFRTVVADIGANSGYIVSRAGFQAGACEAAENTNVKLLNWWDFQDVFEDQWYWEYFTNQVYERLDGLCSYLEPLPTMAAWDMYLDDRDVERLQQLYHQHLPLGVLLMTLQKFMAIATGKKERVILPLGDRASYYGDLPESLTSISGYREFLNALLDYSYPILGEFQHYKDKAFARKAQLES